MSHNKIKIGNKTPNANGVITLELNDLNNVNASSPSNTQLLKYVSASSEWQAADESSITSTIKYILAGQGESNAYSNSTSDTSITTSHVLGIYDTSPLNTITGATFTKQSGTDWIKSITLPAGKYQIWLTYRVEFSASGAFLFAVYSGSTRITNFAGIGETLTSAGYGGIPSVVQAIIDLSSTTTIQLKPAGTINIDTPSNQGTIPSQYSSIYIEKLS